MKITKHTEKWEAEGGPHTQAIAFQSFRGTESLKGCPNCPKPHSLKVWDFPQVTVDLRKLDWVGVWEGFTPSSI